MLEDEGLLITQGTSGRIVTDNEDVIKIALLRLQEDYIKRVVNECGELGLSKDDFIRLINEYYERKDNI